MGVLIRALSVSDGDSNAIIANTLRYRSHPVGDPSGSDISKNNLPFTHPARWDFDSHSSTSFALDANGQLLSVAGSRAESYGYDANGNRSTNTTGTGNLLLNDSQFNYTCDFEGNRKTKTRLSDGQVTEYYWDHRNQLTLALVKNANGVILKELRFTYDVEGRRVGTWVDADGAGPLAADQVWTIFDGVNPYLDLDNQGNLQERYLYGPGIDELFARIGVNENPQWYLTDRLGSVRQIVDGSGTILDEITYDSYGNILSETNPLNGDRFKFTGREFSPELGIYYYRARWYDPATGQFISQDPIGFNAVDPNLYRYVVNGPGDGTDPLGLESKYRREFLKETPDMPTWWEVHHTKQQALFGRYLAIGINVDQTSNLRGVPPNIHYEITELQNKWAACKMREMGILKPNETLNDSNKGDKFKKFWATVNLKDIERIEKDIQKEYGEFWLKPGKNQKGNVIYILSYSDGGQGQAAFSMGKGSRFLKILKSSGQMVAFFSFFMVPARVGLAAQGHTPEQIMYWNNFSNIYQNLLEEAIETNGISYHRAHSLKESFIQYGKSIGLPDKFLDVFNISIGSYIDTSENVRK